MSGCINMYVLHSENVLRTTAHTFENNPLAHITTDCPHQSDRFKLIGIQTFRFNVCKTSPQHHTCHLNVHVCRSGN